MKGINKYMIMQLLIGVILLLLFLKTKHIILLLLSILYIIFKIKENKNKNGFIVLLIMYFIGLSYYLFFEPLFGRTGNFEFLDLKSLEFNLIPFKTITEYLKAIFDIPYAFKMSYDTDSLFLNLIGNFLCMAPLGLLLPLSFERQKEKKNFLKTSLIICLTMELLQCLSMNGSFDIDDFILNYLGAIIAYFISINDIIPFIEKILLEEEIEVNNKLLMIKFIVVLLLSILLVLVFKHRDSNELEYIKELDYYEFEFLGDYQEDYTELICEDEYNKYYLNHYKIDDIRIIIVGEQYSLSDYLENKTIVHPNCEKLISAGLDITRKEK